MRRGPFLVPWTTTGTEGEPGPKGHGCSCRLSPSGPSPPTVTGAPPGRPFPPLRGAPWPGPARPATRAPCRPPSAAANARRAEAVDGSRRQPPFRYQVALSLLTPAPSAGSPVVVRGGKPGLPAAPRREGNPGSARRHPAGCRALAAAGAGKLSAGPARDRALAGDLRLHAGSGGTAAGPPRRQLRQRCCSWPGSQAGPGQGAGEAAFGNKAPARRGGGGEEPAVLPGRRGFRKLRRAGLQPASPGARREERGWEEARGVQTYQA